MSVLSGRLRMTAQPLERPTFTSALREGLMTMRARAAAVAAALSVTLAVSALAAAGQRDAARPGANAMSLYDFKTTTLLGQPADLGAYRGKVTLVVNVASYCGYTPQYKGLERLHRELQGQGFAVLGFPSNDFGEQEPGSEQEIAEFCRLTYDVTFPMFSKVVTRRSAEQSPVYGFLGQSGNLPAWNFAKYLIGKTGRVLAFYPSDVTPESPQLRQAITRALSAP